MTLRKVRKDRAAAHRLIGRLLRSVGHTKTDDELTVEAWLWLVIGEDAAARQCLDARGGRRHG